MEIEISDASGLPEWMQSHVSEGKLNLADLPQPEDVSGLKSALQKERENAQAWSKWGTPQDVEAKMQELQEAASKGGKGSEEAQAKLDALKAEYETKLTAKEDAISKMMQRNAVSDLKVKLAEAGFITEAIDDIASSAMGRIQFNEDGSPKVMTVDGKPMIGSGADHGATLADLAKELADAKPYAVRDGGKGGSGKQPGTSGGKPKAEFKRSTMKPQEKAAFISEHGPAAYSSLPE